MTINELGSVRSADVPIPRRPQKISDLGARQAQNEKDLFWDDVDNEKANATRSFKTVDHRPFSSQALLRTCTTCLGKAPHCSKQDELSASSLHDNNNRSENCLSSTHKS